MSKKDSQLWKYPLPDDWTPTGTWCLQVTIPADQQYADIVYGALGSLTQEKPFQPDVTGEGPAAVAAAFEAALYIVPFSLSQTCIVTPIPPIPDQAAADDAAAAVFTVFFQYLVSQIVGCASGPGDCAGCVDDLMTTLGPYGASDAVRGALSRLCADIVADPTAAAQFETDCPYTDQYDDLRSKIADNPYDWLNHLSDWIFNWLNTTSSNIFNDLNTVAGLLGGGGVQGFINDHGGIPSGGGATFGGDCPWTHVFHFDAGDGLWEAFEYCASPYIPGAVYSAGVGWEDRLGGQGCEPWTYVVRDVRIKRSFALTTILSFRLDYDVTVGSYDGGSPASLFRYSNLTGFDSAGVGSSPWEWSGSASTSYLEFQVLVGYDSNIANDPGGSATMVTLTITGSGTDPFL